MERYFEILNKLEEEKIDIVKLYLLSGINMTKDTKKEEWKIVNYCYNIWLSADIDLSLDRLADIVVNDWEKIENGEITTENILEKCSQY